ncbi:MAG: hypothetical protein AB2693_23130 [Candidatus Thiodiazotropha sp.]
MAEPLNGLMWSSDSAGHVNPFSGGLAEQSYSGKNDIYFDDFCIYFC